MFLLLVKAAARRAPLPTLTSQPAVPDLITDPREDCLIRDRHRCIITQAFDFDEAVTRHKQHAGEAKDDEGVSLFPGGDPFLHLEAAPVLPHSLAEIESTPSELVRPQLYGLVLTYGGTACRRWVNNKAKIRLSRNRVGPRSSRWRCSTYWTMASQS